MSKIMYKGVPYGGGGTSGASNVEEVTKAEYDALEAAGAIKNDTLYLIKDGYVGVDASMGNADISGIGDGTLTGAISALDTMRKTKTIMLINDCSTAQEIGDLMLANADKIGKCENGDSNNNPIRNVVTNPTGYSNYTNAFFEVVSEVLIRVTAINLLGTARPQIGYIWHNGISWLWSGWG